MSDDTDPEGFQSLLQQFLEWLQVQHFSACTVTNHRKYLGYFIKWATQRGLTKPAEVTQPIIERYQRFVFHYRQPSGDPLSAGSQHSQLTPLKNWFRWLVRQHHIGYNPAGELELPKLGQRLPRTVLTAREAELVLAVPDVKKPRGLRDRAILETLYSTGLRRLELSALCRFDVDRERGTVMVRQGKGKKDRVIPIGERALAWIDRYEQEARPKLLVGDQAGDVLFLTHLGTPLRPGALTALVREYVDAAQLGKHGACHLWRHTMATLMLENGADVRYVQEMLGHVKLTTTQVYTRVSIKKLKEVHTATHPARLKRPE